MNRVYFDFNATTPIAPEVAAAMRPFLGDEFGNASNTHWAGQRIRAAIDQARSQVASLLHCEASEVAFTSGGTEANNWAFVGLLFGVHNKRVPHFIVSAVEHPSVLNTAAFAERMGARVTRIPVDIQGRVDPDDIRRAITNQTVLISVMHAQNEVGTVQPIREIADIALKRGVLSHTDAAQSTGKIETNVAELGVDLLTVAGHKMYAPAGVGALYIRSGVSLSPFMHGAGHETGRRAGTENVLEIVGLGAASELARRWLGLAGVAELRVYFWNRLCETFGDQVALHGHPTVRLPNTLNVGFLGRQGHEILASIPELAASTGSACHAGDYHLSPVLAAMGIAERSGLGAIRFSLGRTSTRDEVDQVVARLKEVLNPRVG